MLNPQTMLPNDVNRFLRKKLPSDDAYITAAAVYHALSKCYGDGVAIKMLNIYFNEGIDPPLDEFGDDREDELIKCLADDLDIELSEMEEVTTFGDFIKRLSNYRNHRDE